MRKGNENKDFFLLQTYAQVPACRALKIYTECVFHIILLF